MAVQGFYLIGTPPGHCNNFEMPYHIELHFSYTAPALFRDLVHDEEDIRDSQLGHVNLYSRYVLFNSNVLLTNLTQEPTALTRYISSC